MIISKNNLITVETLKHQQKFINLAEDLNIFNYLDLITSNIISPAHSLETATSYASHPRRASVDPDTTPPLNADLTPNHKDS